jgi:subtilisin family serine protease
VISKKNKKDHMKKSVAKAPSRGRAKKPNAKSNQRVDLKLHARRTVIIIAGTALLFGVVWSAWAINHTGSVRGILSAALRAAPLAQQETTKNYTVDGIAKQQTILIKYKAGVSAATKQNINSQAHTNVKRVIPNLDVQEVQLPSATTVGDAIKQYRSRSEIQYAEPNFVAQRFMSPNDSLYQKQWSLFKINAASAWDVSQGGFGPIAIIDTGIDTNHSDLKGEVQAGYNFVANSTDTNDDNGHGTHVAGIISGETNNTTGVASIGFTGSLIPVKVLDSTGAGSYASVASGIIYAADHGARIINLSLGGSSASQTLESAVNYALKKGVIVVAAAGNNGNAAAVYPANYAGVIAVSATTASDTLANFSSYGNHTYISAPGVGIISTYNNGGYATMSGTSMAAPEVAGLLGLALSHSNVTSSTLLTYLRQSSDKIGPYGYDGNGWNQYFGYGRINAGKLMALLSTSAPVSTPETTTSIPSTANGQLAHGQDNTRFSAEISGTVDSINTNEGKATVRVQSISQNLKVAQGNLVDVYFNGQSIVKSGNQTFTLANLQTGDKLSGKVLWQDNALTAVELTLQQTNRNNNSRSQNTNRH